MLPALIIVWAMTKMVHHSSPCCKEIDQYFCIPKPHISPRKTEFISQLKIPHAHENTNVGDTEDIFLSHETTSGEYDEESLKTPSAVDDKNFFVGDKYTAEYKEIDRDLLAPIESEYHVIQVVPEAMINTDNENTVITGSENENENLLNDGNNKYDSL